MNKESKNTIISCKDLVLGYNGNAVISGLSFDVHQGDYLCIIGENGSGKTTLMKTLLGLQTPMSGEIQFLNGLKRTEIGYLPQQTDHQKDFPASVYEIVLSGNQGKCGLRPFYNKQEKELTELNIKKVNIEHLRNKCYMELSGGQQQRVLLARALCATSKIILLDEPIAGLDPQAQEEMYALIKKLNKDGITIIMITHDVNNTLDDATHILKIGHQLEYIDKLMEESKR